MKINTQKQTHFVSLIGRIPPDECLDTATVIVGICDPQNQSLSHLGYSEICTILETAAPANILLFK